MSSAKTTAVLVGAASVAEVGAHLALDSALASVAAFGSVLGLGVLHLRARRAKRRAPAPALSPEVPLMSSVAPLPNADPTTPAALAEITARLDELARDLDDESSARIESLLADLAAAFERGHDEGASRDHALLVAIEDARKHVAQLVVDLRERQAKRDEEATRRASALVDTCRALDERLASSEAQLVAHAQRMEKAIAENGQRAASHEAIARLCRDLSGLREDVNRVSLSLAELRAQPRAPIGLDEEHARAMSQAGESAAAVARRVASLHERLDAHTATLERSLGDGFRNARVQIDELARSASALRAVSERVGEDVAEAEGRLAEKIDHVREALARLPRPEPVLAPLREAEERLRARMQDLPAETATRVADAIERLPSPERIDLAPLHAALRDTEARIAALPAPEPVAAPLRELEARLRAHIEGVAGSIPPPEPVAAHLRETEARLAARVESLPAEIAARLATLPHDVATRVLDQIPPPEGVDLAPLRDAIRRAELALAALPTPEPVAAPLREMEGRLAARIDEVRSSLPSAEPVAAPLREAETRIAARMESLASEVASAVAAALPPRESLDLSPVHEAETRLADRIQALPQETATRVLSRLPAFPVEQVADAVEQSERRVLARVEPALRALRTSVESIPAPEPAPTFPVAEIAETVRAAEDRIEAGLRATREQIAALPAPPELDLAPVLDAVGELGERLAPVEERLVRRMASLTESSTLRTRQAIESLPRPEPVSLDPVLHAVRDSEERLAQRVAALDASRPLGDLASRLQATAMSADVARLQTLLEQMRPEGARAAAEIRRGQEEAAGALATLEEKLLAFETAARASLARLPERAEHARVVEGVGALQQGLRDLSQAHDAATALHGETLAQAETRLLVDSAQRHDESLAAVATLSAKMADAAREAAKAHEDARKASAAAIESLAARAEKAVATAQTQASAEVAGARDEVVGRVERSIRSASQPIADALAGLSGQMGAADGALVALRADLAEATRASAARDADAMGALAAARDTLAQSAEETRRHIEAAAARASEDALSIHDNIEDLRAEADARHRRVEAGLAELRRTWTEQRAADEARVTAVQQRLDKLAREMEQRGRAADERVVSMEERIAAAIEAIDERWNARMGSIESRLLDELRAMQATPREATSPLDVALPHPRPRRHHRPAGE